MAKGARQSGDEMKNDPAFPSHVAEEMSHQNGDRRNQVSGGGLTKRELLAAMAMQGLLANVQLPLLMNNHSQVPAYEQIGHIALKNADALIAELEKSK